MFFRNVRRSVVNRIPALAIGLMLAAGVASAADLSQAVVRQKVNVVTIASSQSAEARPASTGSIVRDDNVVRTGTESRAELEFQDLTLARLGANSIFSFDAQGRTLTCNQGAVLFAKPSNSGRVEVRAGSISAAITGSTGFISNKRPSNRSRHADPGDRTTMVGMLEGKLEGCSTWRDGAGKEHTYCFKLGPGEMIVAQPGMRPTVVQFDIPRFVRTSPLITAYSTPLPNNAQLNRALAQYNADVARGFVQPATVAMQTQSTTMGWVSRVNWNSFDAAVQSRNGGGSSDGGFIDVGGNGVIRGQLIWDTFADLDLHLILPDGQEVYYANRTVPFNNGRATAMLDHDNLGGQIDQPPQHRVENIAITGVPSNGMYRFFVDSFSTPNSSDPFTLRIGSGSNMQVITGNLPAGQQSQSLTLNFNGSGGR
jgi:hypothetical protein